MIWNSSVIRWHTDPSHALQTSGDTTSSHTTRCLWLLLSLHPEASAGLLRAVILHDVGERGPGDASSRAKKRWPELNILLQAAEEETLMDIGMEMPMLTPYEKRWLKLVDRLDALLWIREVAPNQLERDDVRELQKLVQADMNWADYPDWI